MAIGLVLVEGLSYREAAEVLDVPIGTLTAASRVAVMRWLRFFSRASHDHLR